MKGWNGKVTQGSDELKAGGSGEAQSTAFIRSPVGLTSKQLIRLPDRPHCYTHSFTFYFLVLVLLQELRFATALTYTHSTRGFLNDPEAPGGSLEMLAEERAGRFSFCLWTFIHFCCNSELGFLLSPSFQLFSFSPLCLISQQTFRSQCSACCVLPFSSQHPARSTDKSPGPWKLHPWQSEEGSRTVGED